MHLTAPDHSFWADSIYAQFQGVDSRNIQDGDISLTSAYRFQPRIFSPAIITGDLVYTSGQIGIDSKTGQLAEGFEAQLEQVFKNLTAVLEASGSSIDHVVKATVFLADMNDYNKLNELYAKQFKGDPPARSTVQVARLPRDARIEIEVVAVLK